MNENEIKIAVQTLVKECEWHFKNADNYSALKNEFQRREKDIVRPVGKRINEAGGLSLMRRVYSEVESICLSRFSKGCRSALDAKWNGIGDWMS